MNNQTAVLTDSIKHLSGLDAALILVPTSASIKEFCQLNDDKVSSVTYDMEENLLIVRLKEAWMVKNRSFRDPDLKLYAKIIYGPQGGQDEYEVYHTYGNVRFCARLRQFELTDFGYEDEKHSDYVTH